MKKLKYYIERELYKLRWIKEKIPKDSDSKERGFLEIEHKGKRTNYFIKTKNSETEKYEKKYIKRNEEEVAKDFVQKAYNRKILKIVNKIIPLLTKLNKIIKDNIIDDVFEDLSKDKKELINPVIPTKKQILEKWKNEEYIGNGFDPEYPEIYTNRNERVRSKSEKILADRFDYFGLEYKYEYPLKIKGVTFYPDFTFLNLRTNQKIYWEHLEWWIQQNI